jgi:hypothetical protein
MKTVKTMFAVVAAIAATSAFADDHQQHQQNLVKMSCPALTALRHAGPGAPWTLDQKSTDAGFFVVQSPDAVASKLTSFENMYGGLSVYFNDQKYGPRFDVTCLYESGDDVVEVKSMYSYDFFSVVDNANLFPANYKTHGNSSTECAKGFTNGDFGPEAEHICEWEAYVVKAGK